ncbi:MULTISPECIES: biosynthetic-type acetolactate synthase large subunit [Desulfovibrio]|jgi:acetolactate synthase-1/2/3 large subunit|uniref:Acetolactate synthase n=6 Tax=Desulfovibrionaceae TaxID=194924 RepID=A0A848C8I2_9BACT|nr:MULTISPECIES: biosynthetic-type acetolactate synthase large subunit [Desulfovibrio]MBM6893544.1 biosynthetic-type acetolactate synthase large subunit [Desulfovibrio piger]MBR2610198.1 biosynthetic-type acetolactate synthase large subunit [Desulfovibrio sp.]MBS5807974.1 biosynthetic-type acetolactate synthase large subunit [Desulfovibrio piger]MCI6941500.1 biosynthetic-type acetolactate synthase large subunit [Desulfovibrio piger]MCI7374115.1 biosynthetic-type acetolactate synthase large sub
MELTGAQILLESLKKEGVDVLFGYPGGAVIDIYDELPRHPELKHVLVRHEQGAVHAADGYARASGKVGCCLVTSGPGATNTVTGIATAYCDSIPLVVFTGQVPTQLIGNDAFQEVDIVGITRPCTKHNFLVKDVRNLAKTIRQAFYLARSGRPGPVLVDLPKDIMQARTEFVWPEDIFMRSYNPTYKPNLNQLRRTAEELAKARKPIILAGGGVIMANASEVLCELAHELNIPVATTLMGLGAFPANGDLWLGMVGMHGTYAANMSINHADLLVCVGARFDDRVTGRLQDFASHARIVHIDIDPTSIRKNVEVDVPVVGDCRQALEGILEICRAKMADTDWSGMHADWLQTVHEWKANHPLAYNKNGHIKPQQVIETMYSITKGDAIIATEVGQNQMWAAQFYTFTKPRTLLTSGGLGTMGYGFPAAIGAQFAFPDKLVINVAGDGSIQMNIQELATVVQNKIPVKVVILNNGHLGMVRQWQELFYNRNYSHTNMEAQPDFVKLAEAYGAEGYRISKPEELEDVLRKALTSPNPAFIDVMVEREENVYPMVPAGAALDEMLLV